MHSEDQGHGTLAFHPSESLPALLYSSPSTNSHHPLSSHSLHLRWDQTWKSTATTSPPYNAVPMGCLRGSFERNRLHWNCLVLCLAFCCSLLASACSRCSLALFALTCSMSEGCMVMIDGRAHSFTASVDAACMPHPRGWSTVTDSVGWSTVVRESYSH